MAKKYPCQAKTQDIWKFCQNTGNLVSSSCKFPDSKGKRYFKICCENLPIFLKLDMSPESVLCMTVIVTNHKDKFAVGQEKHRKFENAI